MIDTAEVKRLREREATFDEFIDSLDGQNEHEWMLIERIDEIHERLHGGEEAHLAKIQRQLLEEVKRLREQLTSADKMIRNMIRETRDTPREAYVSGSAREAEQLFVHVLEANWDEVIE